MAYRVEIFDGERISVQRFSTYAQVLTCCATSVAQGYTAKVWHGKELKGFWS